MLAIELSNRFISFNLPGSRYDFYFIDKIFHGFSNFFSVFWTVEKPFLGQECCLLRSQWIPCVPDISLVLEWM